MIQRKQTLYLLVAAVLMTLAILQPLATYYVQDGELVLKAIDGLDMITDQAASTSSILIYLTALMAIAALMPIVIIFLYKNLLLQARLCFTEVVLLLCTQGFVAYHIYICKTVDIVSWKFGIPAVFPIIALIFTLLAIRGIVHDHKLIKSLNRIR
jgi:hypothetical protein